jgi:hypothetical protein
VQSIEYISIQEVCQPKILLSLEVHGNSVDHVACGWLQSRLERVSHPPGDARVAKTSTATPSKTHFVLEFVKDNPQANAKAVNEAWTAAGMKGTISHPVISEVRKQLGLTGKRPGKPRKAAKGKATPGRPTAPGGTPGKTMFVKEFLHDHPQGNLDAVNEAWTAAGNGGTISRTLVDKTRARLGLTGKPSGKSRKAGTSASGKKRGRPRKATTAMVDVQPRGGKNLRTVALTHLEADIDGLIFQAMAIGELREIEDTLRRARRLLYEALTRG